MWPEGKRFAFTVFDDPDGQSFETSREVYAFLSDLGLRTTKGVWPLPPSGTPSDLGVTCGDPRYVAWLQDLQRSGFEIGYHNATAHTSAREDTLRGLVQFAAHFGTYPKTMSQHYFCDEGMYWGDSRLTGLNRTLYRLLTLGRGSRQAFGHVAGHPFFWGDLCRERVKYHRNFVFPGINTLAACPFMPYHDPLRPYTNYWYASSEGATAATFTERISEANQDRLEEDGGACIMYTHFGHGYYTPGELNPRFRALVKRLSERNGWFVPVGQLLDYLLARKQDPIITAAQRRWLERRWLLHKIRFGSA